MFKQFVSCITGCMQAAMDTQQRNVDAARVELDRRSRKLQQAKIEDARVRQRAGTSDASSNSVTNTEGLGPDAASTPQHNTRATGKRSRVSEPSPALPTPARTGSKRRAVAPRT